LTDEVKTCVGCKHSKNIEAEPYMAQLQPRPHDPECSHPKAASRDLVNGKAYCRQERNNNKGCGKQGKLWEPRK
jgi:hypothetical protein